MIKKLTPHGNSAALIIDKALLEILHLDMETQLEITTDGENLVISPVRDSSPHQLVAEALNKVNARHARTLKRLAD